MSKPTPRQIRRWQQYLANERAEAAVYRELARNRHGEQREILLRIADAEARHETYWRDKLGNEVGMPRTPDFKTRFLAFMARRFGTVFALAMLQTAESRSPYESDEDATSQMKADEAIHAEVVRGLAAEAREEMSGTFRAAVFGANDGLVSNLALVLGVMASGADPKFVLLAGFSGMLSGALSMGAGEYISVKSSNELLEASAPHPDAGQKIPLLDVDANELALVYRARGMSEEEAEIHAQKVFATLEKHQQVDLMDGTHVAPAQELGGAWGAAMYSFFCFGGGALIPILPFFFNISNLTAGICATILVGIALMVTGSITGVLSGKPPLMRALRQLGIGLGAAGVTYALGAAFGVAVN
ncbi:MAG: VIT1/CCC1 transporter family protein [Corynebacterium sp.]|uniref:VIT1/CCC1 transporter family protein n=1 Tax=Corynebacterium sp. TaxID=1720 RepID=UPI0026DD5083|nr:VIT1/CCC1 transporter family protein [Corynebacterium sp.]MDO4762423.1 VIT1/CCC1 transporter family protein [Corynebacterium sp.]